MGDINIALLVIAIVVSLLSIAVSIYLLINYQHPDDSNQAYFPKLVVVIGLTLAQLSVLMLPADVSNRQSCINGFVSGECSETLPMRTLWYILWIAICVMVFVIIPFSIFLYEGDEEKGTGKRVLLAILWCLLSVFVFGGLFGILYGFVGYVEYPVKRLVSATIPMTNDFSSLGSQASCVSLYNTGLGACSSYASPQGSKTTWTLRVSFPKYIIALFTILGSLLFSIFGGVGIAVLPLSSILSFLRRPRATITRSEYIKEATAIGKKAKEIHELAVTLQQEERSGGKTWAWRRNAKKLQQALFHLEEDEAELRERFPQGEEAEMFWAMTVLLYIGKLIFGVIGLAISVAWIVHITLYMLIQPPAAAFLNEFFITLDRWWGLLGTGAFSIFCFYLFLAVISGEMYLGLNILILSIHPMRWNATLMSSFLFNVALILCCATSAIQFCAKAFAAYAQETAVQEIFGHTLENLQGIRYLYVFNLFQYIFIVMFVVTFIYFLAVVSTGPFLDQFNRSPCLCTDKSAGSVTAAVWLTCDY
ncbi:unnamed protein product [Closterium sp. NIES-53]